MSLKTAIAAVLKAMRKTRGLSQMDLAEVSSRTYVSKLERGQSSPTLEMMTMLSAPLDVSPLTLVALALGVETKHSMTSLVSQLEREIAELTKAGVIDDLQISSQNLGPKVLPTPRVKKHQRSEKQAEFCFAD